MGGIGLFVNLFHLLCGVPHAGCHGLGWRGNAFLSVTFGPSSPDRADNRGCAKIAPQLPGYVH